MTANPEKWKNYRIESYIVQRLQDSVDKNELINILWVYKPSELVRYLTRETLIRLTHLFGLNCSMKSNLEIATCLVEMAMC